MDTWAVQVPSTYPQPSGSFISNKSFCYYEGIVPVSDEPPNHPVLFYGALYAMKHLLQTNTNIPWMPTNSEARLYHTDEMPPVDICYTAFALAFIEDRMLLTCLVKRGWDIPGGHIEPGGSPEQAVIRETIEETQVIVEPVVLVGVQELEVFGSLPRDGWTTPFSATLFYLCRVVIL